MTSTSFDRDDRGPSERGACPSDNDTSGARTEHDHDNHSGKHRGHDHDDNPGKHRGHDHDDHPGKHKGHDHDDHPGKHKGHDHDDHPGKHKGHDHDDHPGKHKGHDHDDHPGKHKGHDHDNHSGKHRGHDHDDHPGKHKGHDHDDNPGKHKGHDHDDNPGKHKGHDHDDHPGKHKGHDHDDHPGKHRGHDHEKQKHVCFVAGTRIAAPGGGRLVENIRAGDRVRTLDDGAARVIWTGTCRVAGTGASAPVRFETGAIGNRAPLRVSQQHRILLTGASVRQMTGNEAVLVPAKALVNGTSVRIVPQPTVTYVHLLLARHALLRANGAIAESLFVGKVALREIGNRPFEEAAALFPELREELAELRSDMRPVRPFLTFRQGRALAVELGMVCLADPMDSDLRPSEIQPSLRQAHGGDGPLPLPPP